MKYYKSKYKFPIALIAASILSLANFSNDNNKANAIGIDPGKVTIMPNGIVTSNTINVQVPEGSVGASFGWNKSGTTRIMKADNSAPATGNGYTTNNQLLGTTNNPPTPQPLYSINPGSSYRLTNVGKTTDGQGVDLIWTVTAVYDKQPANADGVSFNNSSGLGGEKDPYQSIALLVSGYHSLSTNIKYVKAGTNTPITLTSGTYWSDIDIRQGIDEQQSNSAVILPPLGPSKLALDGRIIYSITDDDANGMNDPDFGAYIGVGTGSEFNMRFYNPYAGGQNAGIVNSSNIELWHTYRYDLFGNFDNIKFPSPVTDPKKTVSDIDENKVSNNSTGLTVRNQEYDVSVYVGNGAGPDKLILKDTLPKEFKTDLSKVKITGKNGKDVTSLFDLKLDGQNFTATMKSSSKGNTDLISTRVNVNIKGTLPEWGGIEFKNKGIWTSDKDLPTNEVSSVTPSKPEVIKSVSVDNGTSFNKNDTIENAARVEKNKDSYIWKLDYKLSNYTNYTGIQLIDQLESIQAFNQSDFKVYDSTGADVTTRGDLTTKENGTKTNIIWTAKSDYVKEINTKFGIKSKETPTFTTMLKTDISNASLEQKEAYTNNNLGYIVIPNTGTLIETDHTGSVNSNSNPSHVTFPNELTDPKKTVSDDDELLVNSNNVGLNVRDQSYDISIKTSKGYGFNKLELLDEFPNEFKADLNKVKIINSDRKDITSYFDITLDGQKFKASLKDDYKESIDIKGTTITATIKGTLPRWLGEIFYNDAVWSADEDKPTNQVETYEPSEPIVNKTVSLDDGKTYNKSDTLETASRVQKNKDSYIWKLDYTLSNYTNYTEVELIDQLENIQAFNKSDFKVYDETGADVTENGTITTKENGSKNNISWKANSDYVKTINSKFGLKSKETPKFTTTLKTDVSKATIAQKNKYSNNELGYVIVPNKGTLIETDRTGSFSVDSNLSHVTFPNELSEPIKKVSDDDESLVDSNNVGLKTREQTYDISIKSSKGYGFNILELSDTFPKEFKTDVSKVVITNSARKDITSYFTLTLDGQNFKAAVKDDYKESVDLKGTTITAKITGTLPNWLGEIFYNDALWVADEDKPTNEVETYEPSEPKVSKSVSVDDGKTFNKSDTIETASKIEKNKDSYIWKLDYTLSNYTNYTGIQLIDQLESLQTFNKKDFTVYDDKGVDVTSKGTISTKENGTKTNIIWTASKSYVNDVNRKFGKNSRTTPKFMTKLKTDVTKASLADKAKYSDNALGYIIIPNKGTLIESDHTGDVYVDSNLSHITLPNELSEPIKKVSDDDESLVDSNNVGLKTREQTYDISVKTSKGYGFNKLELSDKLPKEFVTDLSKVTITNSSRKDITSYFTITLDGQNFKAVLKDEFKTSVDLKGTIITAKITGTLPKWLGEIFYNDALWVADEDKPTNEVETYEPSEPKVDKSVSVDDGKTFDKAESPETALAVKNRPDSYIWKLDFTLSNYTNYTGIQLIDHMESLQTINKDDIKVFDTVGLDVTKKGDITKEVVNGKTDVKWTANKEYITEFNDMFGPKSKKVPKFTMTIKTDVQNALSSEEATFFNKEFGYVVIPNKGTLIESDHTGDVYVDSNTSHVKFPKPGESSVEKLVALNGTDPLTDKGWSSSIKLKDHDDLYSYKTTFKLSKNFNYDKGNLLLTDKFENLQKYESIKIIKTNGKDITDKFDFSELKENDDRTTKITATPKDSNEFDDNGDTLIMVISGATLKGASGSQEVNYLEPNEVGTSFDDQNPFKEGVTIPNISNLTQNSGVKDYETNQDTEKTYVNFVIDSSILKDVEDD